MSRRRSGRAKGAPLTVSITSPARKPLAAHGLCAFPRFLPPWARDLRFMLTIAEWFVRVAIERLESRGAHWRLDYLEKDPALGKVNFIAYSDAGTVKLKQRPVPQMPPELAGLFDDAASPGALKSSSTAAPEAKRIPA